VIDLGVIGLCHVGFAVRSIEDFQAGWGALMGIRDWLVVDLPQPADSLQLDGRVVGEAFSRAAFARFGDTAVELVEPHAGRTRTSAWLDEHGPGIHHVAVWVADIGRAIAALPDTAQVSYSPASLHPGTRTSAPSGTDFWAYVELRDPQVPWCLELLDARRADVVRARFGDHVAYPPEGWAEHR